jgi:signal transduction histidine kinase
VTFRTRLLLASLSTLAIGLGALLILGNVLLRHQVGTQTRDLLHERVAAQLATLTVVDGKIRVQEAVNDDALDRQAWILENGVVIERPAGISAALDRTAVALGRHRQAVQRSAGHDLELRAEPVRSDDGGPAVGAVVVAISVASVERLEKLVLIGSLVVAALVLLAGTIAISSALGGALRPVARMTEQADAWGAHDLDSRFDLGPPRDELSGLAATLDHLLDRIAASRRHEQRFASEMAHELRTPVAGIRGRAELALQAAADDAERRRALEAVVEQTTRLSSTIDTLLAIARREIDPAASSVDLAALAHEIDDVTITSPDQLPRAEGEPDVVRRALAPLIDNARRHARTQVTLELTVAGAEVRLTVRDDGPGVPEALGERVFDPGVRGDPDGDGAGLGLPLARRLARSCGGDVRLGAGPGGCVVLVLPIAAPD